MATAGERIGVTVEREPLREAILSSLADAEMMRILDCATPSCKTMNEVIIQTGVPYSTAYRKVKWMLENGLLFTEKMAITPEGKKFSLIRARLKSISIDYSMGQITIQVEYNVNIIEKTAERLFSLGPD